MLVAVRCQKQPERIRDLMGYQALIIDAYMEYTGDYWMGYDRRFRQITASQPDRSWASIDPTLWHLAFAGQAKKTVRCMHCFSLSHHSMTANLLQEASHNVLTNSFLLNIGHNVSQSASSGMRIHSPPVHTKISGFNTYATYVPTIP